MTPDDLYKQISMRLQGYLKTKTINAPAHAKLVIKKKFSRF